MIGSRRTWAILLLAIATFFVGALGGILATGPSHQHFAFLYDHFTIETCLDDRRAHLAEPAAPESDEIVICYNQLRLQGQLNEFLIRRVNFQNQNFATNVVLWMVVVLTLAGVALAGFQIVATTRIGDVERIGPEPPTNEILIERGRLFLRSSITGLIILVVSFGFFYTYVSEVYRIQTVGDALERIATIDGRDSTAPTVPELVPDLRVIEDEFGDEEIIEED